ncbi:DUF1707 domain-containing protein [Tessaracoccus sp. MC1756]|uniref:DUF1707 SHOCT-like domain-containing protein n=1 Tax=Tessaracoccus sp. MC1756 TaxID=2760311 RepID=UPI0016023909|nr:DUF1707 domain-containing protein [Tessaracoccus sp. MC1756]MBB1509882.1 DUF1707 domain-containing protein [Tessaracoccus sp. MC1756]
MAGDFMRIGDAERDDAVGMLREHHATGRLSSEEFDDRMSRALSARTESDLTSLFLDLPNPKPGSPYPASAPSPQPVVPPVYGYDLNTQGYGYEQQPMPYAEPNAPVQLGKPPRPWYAQWWMIFVGIALAGALDWGFLVVLMALWIWLIYPMVFENRRGLSAAPSMEPPRPLTYSEREYVMDEVRAGRKINAVKRYRELTGADLRTAKNTVDSWGRQIGR